MAYDIRSESIKTFINDRNIKLPRFQRKQTWDYKKNFKLCISLFKQFPIGVCIFSVDESKTGKTMRWLLDGRQRKNALTLLNEDPENVYLWAKKFIGFKPNDQPADVKRQFNESIYKFLEEFDDDSQTTNNTASQGEDDNTVEETSSNDSNDGSIVPNDVELSSNDYGINLLLNLILATHRKDAKSSGFTRPFDFTKYVERLPYVQNGDILSSKLLKQEFIDVYRTYCDNKELEYNIVDSFIAFITDRFNIINPEENTTKLKALIKQNWEDIITRIDLLQRVDEVLLNRKIGYIEVKNLTQTESKKIFTLLNSEGAKLNFVEVLSAKAKWNINVKVENEDTKELIMKLYKEQLGTSIENIVKWDLPAIFLKKIEDNIIFRKFEFNKNKPEEYDKALNLGFRCMAGIYMSGVSNNDIENLSNISFDDYETLVSNIKRMSTTIYKFDYFKYLLSWRISLMELTSDYIAMNFLILAYLNFKAMDYPTNGSAAKQFGKNCFMLWDQLIFEYLNGVWKSSSDARIHNNIENTGPIAPLPFEKWESLLGEIFNSSTINGKVIKSQNDCKALLYHLYCLNQLYAPNAEVFDIDHIIPQEKFKTSVIVGKEKIVHNILNLGILPKGDNIKKSSYVLSQIVDQSAKDLITKYEFIEQEDFLAFSNVSNYELMFEKRKKIIMDIFKRKRTDLLNN